MPILDINGRPIAYDTYGETANGRPPLLLVPGGAGHGGVFARFAALSAERFHVTAMSSRVASAGPEGAPFADQDPEAHAADLLGLIEKLYDEPPVVLASSSGAIAALALLTRHGDRVRLAVLHEPPLTELLPDPERHRADLEAVRTAVRTGGVNEAMPLLARALTAGDAATDPAVPLRAFGDWPAAYAETAPEPPTPELLALFGELGALQPVFLERILVPFATSAVDVDALKPRAAKLVPAAGIDSRGQLPYRSAAALANRLGLVLAEFPGGHLGPVERPAQWAEAFAALVDQAV